MRILVTGGAGFIGSNFVTLLLQKHPECEVVVLDKLTYAGNLRNLDEVRDHPQLSFIQGDICNPLQVTRAMRGCTMVVHFAAETHVDRSITDPQAFIRTNIEGTYVLLEAARTHHIERFIQISTDEVYGNACSPLGESRPSLESDAQRPMSPYAASKAAAENLAYSYWTTYHLPLVITRCGNNYGPRQYPEKQLPLYILNALNDRTLPVYGKGNNVRDWIHVQDHAQAILALMHARGEQVHGEVFNIGASEERTILQNAVAVLELLNKPLSLISFVPDRLAHVYRHAVNAEKMQRVCGWHPQISFAAGLAETVRWYQENDSWVRSAQTKYDAFMYRVHGLEQKQEAKVA